MTEAQARLLAKRTLSFLGAEKVLQETERLGQRQATRDARTALAEARRALEEAAIVVGE